MKASPESRKTQAGDQRPHSHGRLHRPRSIGLGARVEKVERTLASAVWEAYGEMFGFRDNHARPFTLELKVMVKPGHPWRVKAEPPIAQQIRQAVRDMAIEADAYRAGRVYCYRCDSADCPHGLPPRPTSIFGGYSSTGLPRWPELTQVLLDLRHPDVDLLFEPSRRDLIAAYIEADVLKGMQLNEFGRLSKTYDILGQVVFGFLHLVPPGAGIQQPERVAMTVQAVETRNLDGSPRLDLNVLGRLWDGSPAIDAFSGPFELRVLKVLSSVRRKIRTLASRSGAQSRRRPARLQPDARFHATSILKEMPRTLEHIGRQWERRTIHAEERRVDNRPTSKAWEDAAAVPDDHILWDDRRHTVVVWGPRNRIHIFSPESRHVTSLQLEAEAIRGRLRRRRWRPLIGDPLERFSAAVGRKEEGARDHLQAGAAEPMDAPG